ncbi:MAG: pseudouridine synthase [Candidatus Rifleibacteriota bacterium]
MGELVRIQKLLANWGIASRRTIEAWIDSGKIAVDGKVITSQGLRVDPEKPPRISIDGKPISEPRKSELRIYVFHKPENVVSTLKDEKGRKSIAHFLPKGKRLYPVGRLDMNSTGLLLITNDGELTNRLLHPSFKVEKEYIVKIHGSTLNRDEKAQFRQGIELEEGKTKPCKLIQHKNPQIFTVILKEGRKRQIRRMFESLGRKVVQLHRIRFGPVKLGNLKPGEMRPLSETEKKDLLKAAGLCH